MFERTNIMRRSQSHQETMGRCLALFPGAFRPPHEAHLCTVLNLASRPDIDEVVVIISNRCRDIPGTTKALDADVALRIWSIYLQDVANVRVEVASHTAVQHAFGYFDRVEVGDTLLFCIGEDDLMRGDRRFDDISGLAQEAGVMARVISLSTGSITVRATALRAMLARGEAGRQEFMAALPTSLTAEQRASVWLVCQKGTKEMSDIIKEKVRALIDRHRLGSIDDLRSRSEGKMDQVFRVRFTDGRRVFVKYAGDTVGSGCMEQNQSLKPRRRLSAERRMLKRLRAIGIGNVELPELVFFDKDTRTLVLTEVCPGGRPLEDYLKRGMFDASVARKASRFLAACHTVGRHVAPVWGDDQTDRQQWEWMLGLRTVEIKFNESSHQIASDLESLKLISDKARERRLFILDYCPKNILVGEHRIGVVNLGLSSTVGDPAYDLGFFLGHYILFGLTTSSRNPCQEAIQEALDVYRQGVGNKWPGICSRVVAFAGATIYGALGDSGIDTQGFERELKNTSTTLLSLGLNQVADTDQVLRRAVDGQLF